MATCRISHKAMMSYKVVILVLYVASLCLTKAAIMGSNTFSLKLIPRFSPESPLYKPNLTLEQIHMEMLQLSYDRALRISTSLLNETPINSTRINPDTIRGNVLSALDAVYLVEVGLGTPPATFYLLFDTGSSKSWVQCHGCTECFTITGGSYKYRQSRTGSFLKCRTPSCDGPCDSRLNCIYEVKYTGVSGSRTKGVVLNDSMTFKSTSGAQETVEHVLFGCGLINAVNFGANTGQIAGVFGMSSNRLSFIGQVYNQVQGKFSYCLHDWSKPPRTTSLLRFGDDANFPSGVHAQTTQFTVFADRYYVDLLDISVDQQRLGIPPDTFKRRDRSGGFIVDSGSARTFILRKPYDDYLKPAVELYFRQFPVRRAPGRLNFDLCYRREDARNVRSFPTITFHLAGAFFQLSPAATFLFLPDAFCFGISPSPFSFSLFGGFGQANHKMLFDLNAKTLSFAPMDCNNG